MKRFLVTSLALLTLGCGNDNTTTSVAVVPQPSPTVVPPIGRLSTWLLAANGSPGNNLEVFRVNTSDGSLSRVQTMPTGAGMVSLEQHPVQPFIYSGGFTSNLILGFRMDPNTGQLAPLAGFPVQSEPENNVVLDRTGRYLYSLGESAIDGFRVDEVTGGLSRLPNFPIQGLGELINGEFDRDNRFLYVADNGTDQVLSYSLNAQTGALTEVSRVSSAPDPFAVEVEPTNQFVYVSQSNGNLNGFARNPSGTLTQLSGLPVRYAPANSNTARFDFNDRFLFIGDRTSRTLNAFQIGTGGQLAQVTGYPVPGGSGDVATYPLPNAPYLYSADRPGNQINPFLLGPNGATTPLPSVPAGGAPNEVLPVVLTF